MNNIKHEKSCGAVIYRKNHDNIEILLIKHQNGGHWSFPKGHVENNETEVQTAKREILEETALHASIDTHFRQVVTYSPMQGVTKDVVYFAGTVNNDRPTAQIEEVELVKWLPYNMAIKTISHSSDKSVLENFKNYIDEK